MAFNSASCRGDILVVDDLVDNLRMLSDTLSSEGHRVRAVRNGSMALMGARTAPPDLILLDIRMPMMDGFEVCRQLKNDAITQGIPVIFLSALDEAVDKARAFEAGGVDYITKPFHVVEVRTRVQHHLTIQQLQNQVLAQQEQLELLAREAFGTSQSEPAELTSAAALQAVNLILAYAAGLDQGGGSSPEQERRLQALRQHGEDILQLLLSLDQD
ncbi:response regulator [Nodosilinea nodulosa]|uniref:response regulator n=1 Tax=Nodosilinea nodulosa TaxID=416001 RepID=UPI00036C089A|nr:response regulator [Nodosilinea nodulosa]